jgi:hypothetical protein
MARKTVRFYALIDISDNGEERIYDDLDRAGLIRLLNELVAGGEASVELPSGQSLIVKPLGRVRNAYCLVLYRVSSQDLPMLYNQASGEIRPLDEIMGDEAFDIAEPTYFALFPEGILGFVYNHPGPKPRHLIRYLDELTNIEADAWPIPRPDALMAVEQAGGVKAFSIKIPTAGVSALRDTTLADALRLADTMQAGDIEITLHARGDAQRQRLAQRVQEVARSLIEPLRHQDRAKLKVELEGDDDYVGERALDLLNEYFVIEREISTIPGRRRYLEEGDAVRSIIRAYSELEGSLLEAVGAIQPER